MIDAALLLFLSVPEASSAPVAAKPQKTESKSCRDMIMSSSRLGPVRICKTRAQWRRYDECHRSVTRYCSPKKRSASAQIEGTGGKLVCKYVQESGTRLMTKRVCATAREWELAVDETQKSLRDRQMVSKSSTEPF